ncbi:MAG: hypothetical protein RLZZ385_504 [Pseudomonadota bacterium]|jgi:MATE family multidrug resistance protein
MAALLKIDHVTILRRAWPIILANATVPLLGLADTAVLGNLGTVTDLGAIALGALLFSFVYWSFGFLRMGTTGFVAQAAGAGDEAEVRAALGRALLIAAMLGCLLIVLRGLIDELAFSLLSASGPVETVASGYFQLRIWGAPATLAMFVLMGVLIGLGNSRLILLLQLLLNGLNISLDVWFAGYLGMGARGIALGTLLAEWITLGVALVVVVRLLATRRSAAERFWSLGSLLDSSKLRKTLVANLNIMVRTLLLIFSFAWFTNQSARFGDAVLAANHILLELVSFAAFFLDGYAFVVESLVGTAVGARDRAGLDLAIRRSSELAVITAVGLALLLWLGGPLAITGLTDLAEVRQVAGSMVWLAAIYVLLSFAAFQLDGIFIGAGRTAAMRNAALLSTGFFLLVCWPMLGLYGAVGLWWAFILFVVARAVALLFYLPALRASIA